MHVLGKQQSHPRRAPQPHPATGAVHLTGGLAACMGAWVLGPRKGRYDANGNVVEMPGHNAALATLGVFILWFGW